MQNLPYMEIFQVSNINKITFVNTPQITIIRKVIYWVAVKLTVGKCKFFKILICT